MDAVGRRRSTARRGFGVEVEGWKARDLVPWTSRAVGESIRERVRRS